MLGVFNILTDVMLLILPLPVVIAWDSAWRRKIKFYILFTLGIFVIVVTIVRLPINSLNKSSQVNRTTWATVELLTAAIVVNAPTLHGLWNASRQKSSTLQENSDRSDHAMESWRARDPQTVNADSDASAVDLRHFQPVGVKQTAIASQESRGSHDREADLDSSHDVEGGSVHSSQRGILKD